LSNRYSTTAIVVVFLGLAWLVLSESALRPRHEILYRLSPALSQCSSAAAKETCVAEYHLSLANSGLAPQERVAVHWPAQFAGWSMEWTASDLVASAKRRADPQVILGKDGESAQEIRDLAPNTLLELTLRCIECSRAQLEATRQAAVRIEARGKVIEREPRTTMLGRAALNAARLLGIFF
jgi:hypothetical protein